METWVGNVPADDDHGGTARDGRPAAERWRVKCRCEPGSPFHWREPDYASGIDWSPLQHNAKTARRAAEIVQAAREIDGIGQDIRLFTRAKPGMKVPKPTFVPDYLFSDSMSRKGNKRKGGE
jgi:hypothetical protein